MTTDTAQLRELLAKATPGEWQTIDEETDISISGEGWFEGQYVNGWVIVGNPDRSQAAIAVLDMGQQNHWNDTTLDANAAAIVALHNAAPTLLDELDRLRAELAEARKEKALIVAWLRKPRGAMQHIIDDLAQAIKRGEHRSKSDD